MSTKDEVLPFLDVISVDDPPCASSMPVLLPDNQRALMKIYAMALLVLSLPHKDQLTEHICPLQLSLALILLFSQQIFTQI